MMIDTIVMLDTNLCDNGFDSYPLFAIKKTTAIISNLALNNEIKYLLPSRQ